MNGSSYLEWKTIKLCETSEDEQSVDTPVLRKDRRVGESKSLPSGSSESAASGSTLSPANSPTNSTLHKRKNSNTNSVGNASNSTGSDTAESSMIQIEIIPTDKCCSTTERDRESFASNTIKRYSRFRAKQERKTQPKPRPKSLDHHIYVNLESAVDKNTLVQHWINRTHTISEEMKEVSRVTKVKCGKSIPGAKAAVENLEDDDVPLELRCPVCLDLYQKPLFLPCGHTYCKGCIQKVVDSSDRETKRKQRFVCPTCRNIIKYGNEGIDALPKNINLEFAVKRYETGHGVKAPICQSHIKYRQEKVIWCEDCNVCICPLCIFDGNHKNHQVAPVNVMKEFQHVRKRLKKTKMVLAGRVDDLHKSLQSIEKNKDGLNTKCVQMRKKIDKECESMIALIKKQHQDMYLQMESAMTKKQKRKEKQIATIANDIDRTNSILSEIQSILDTEQPAAFLEKVKTSKAVESECPSLKHQPSLLSTNRIAATPPPRPPKLPTIKDQLKAASK